MSQSLSEGPLAYSYKGHTTDHQKTVLSMIFSPRDSEDCSLIFFFLIVVTIVENALFLSSLLNTFWGEGGLAQLHSSRVSTGTTRRLGITWWLGAQNHWRHFHSYLVVDDGCQVGCQQELLRVVSAWASLGFLTAWWLGSRDECPKKARWKLHLHFNLASEVTEHLDSREGMKI